MGDHEQTSTEDYARGFRRELKEAVNAALIRDNIPVGDERVIRVTVKRLSANPHHDYLVDFD